MMTNIDIGKNVTNGQREGGGDLAVKYELPYCYEQSVSFLLKYLIVMYCLAVHYVLLHLGRYSSTLYNLFSY
jgi:hypothetical protein